MRAVLLVIVIAFAACTTTRKVDLTFKRENVESLTTYLASKNVSYQAGDIATLTDINTFIEYNNAEKLSVPEAYFFNKNGYRVKDTFKGASCGQVINNVDQINTAPSENKEHIKDWVAKYNFPLNPANDLAFDDSKYDAYIIISWAVFTDKFNEPSFNWYKSVKDNPRLKLILLNLDVQDNWILDDHQKSVLGLQ